MSRVEIAATQITRDGVFVSETSGAADGHSFQNTGRTFLLIRNAHATQARTITIQTPQTVLGLAVAELVVTIAATLSRLIGPFPTATFNQSGGLVYVDYSDVGADVKISVYRL